MTTASASRYPVVTHWMVLTGVEVPPERGQGDGHNGRVEDGHDRAEHDDKEIAALGVKTDVLGARLAMQLLSGFSS